jgi:hypothetical protein
MVTETALEVKGFEQHPLELHACITSAYLPWYPQTSPLDPSIYSTVLSHHSLATEVSSLAR